eukprot:3926235-Lingulodinium_polyedra.AAC.1
MEWFLTHGCAQDEFCRYVSARPEAIAMGLEPLQYARLPDFLNDFVAYGIDTQCYGYAPMFGHSAGDFYGRGAAFG